MFLMDVTLLETAGDGDWRRGGKRNTEGRKSRPKHILRCEVGAEIEYIHPACRCCRGRRTRM